MNSRREIGEGAPTGEKPHPPVKKHRWWTALPRRRRYIVNWRYQLRAGLFSVGFTLILLFLVGLNVYFTNKASTEALLVVNPELRSSLEVKDRLQMLELGLGSAVLALAIFTLGIFESHKTAGASFNLRRTLNRLRDGSYNTVARLRSDDNLQELIAPINELARALQAANAAEIETLQAVVEDLGRMTDEPSRRELTSKLLDLIREKKLKIAQPGAGREAASRTLVAQGVLAGP